MVRAFNDGCLWSELPHMFERHKLPKLKMCSSSRPPRKKALLVGINSQEREDGLEASLPNLSGPHYDVAEMEKFLLTRGYVQDDIVVMVDGSENKALVPTRLNLVKAMKHLVCGARAGDYLFFHYSGHSDELPNTTGTEPTGKDQVIKTSDSKTIRDNDLRKFLVDPLHEGVVLTAIFDTCHSATLLDLPHQNCNQVWVPWISKGVRQAASRWATQVRKDALLDIHRPSGGVGHHGHNPVGFVGHYFATRLAVIEELMTKKPFLCHSSRRSRRVSLQKKSTSVKVGLEVGRSVVPMGPVVQHLEKSCDITKEHDCPSGPSQLPRRASSLPLSSPLSLEINLEATTSTFIMPGGEHEQQSSSPEPWLGFPIERSTSPAPLSPPLDAFASGGQSRASSSDTWCHVDPINSRKTSLTAAPLIACVGTAEERCRTSSRDGWQPVFGTVNSPIRTTSTPAPERAFECDGWCRGKVDCSASVPRVVSISACKDTQSAWEDPNGKSMTLSLLDFLKAHPDATLNDILTDVSHKIHQHVMKLHDVARAVCKAKSDGASTSSSKCSPTGEDSEDLEMHNFQDPQLASLLPLDMNEPFVF